MISASLLSILTVTASVSPLLTFVRLWQIKEWRWDRLAEHMRREGIMQLFSKPRVFILSIWIIILVAQSVTHMLPFENPGIATFWILMILTLLSVIQFITRRQPFPVATKKAALFIALTCTLNLLLSFGAIWSFGSVGIFFCALLPFIQPHVSIISWLLLLPLDIYLKKRILKSAMKLREEHKELLAIGITGSVGKTTTKELIKHLLQDLHPLATPEHVNTELGVATWLLKTLKKDLQKNVPMVIEMGAYKKGEIGLLCKIAKPSIGIVTAIGPQHIALFGSLKKIMEAKGELLESIPKDGYGLLNADNKDCKAMERFCDCNVVHISKHDVQNLREEERGIAFTCKSIDVQTSVHGIHNATNVLLAWEVASLAGIEDARIAELLATFSSMDRTFQIRNISGIQLLDDTYNASTLSMNAAIEWAETKNSTSKVLLTAGIQELGIHEDTLHRELGKRASEVFDRIVFTEPTGMRAFQEGFGKPVEFLTDETTPIEKGGLLVCVGRMTAKTIERLLP